MVNLSAQPGATGYHIQSTSRCELESSLSQSYRSYRLSALQWRSRYRDDDTSILDPGLRCLWWPVGCRRSRTEGAPPARRSRRFWRRLLPSTWAPSIDWKQKNISSVLKLNMIAWNNSTSWIEQIELLIEITAYVHCTYIMYTYSNI